MKKNHRLLILGFSCAAITAGIYFFNRATSPTGAPKQVDHPGISTETSATRQLTGTPLKESEKKRQEISPKAKITSPIPKTAVSKEAVAAGPVVDDEFKVWIKDQRSSIVSKSLQKGIALAEARKPWMENLIQTSPRTALDRAVGYETWANLPEELKSLVEEPFSEAVDFRARRVCFTDQEEGAETMFRIISQEGTRYAGYPTGQREGFQSKDNMPLQGIRLNQVAALEGTTFQIIGADDAPYVTKAYPLANPDETRDFLTGEDLPETPLLALAGGQRYLFANAESVETLNKLFSDLDRKPGPQGGSDLLHKVGYAQPQGLDVDALQQEAYYLASTWSRASKDVYFLRVDFPDLQGGQVSESRLEDILNDEVEPNIKDFSNNVTSVRTSASRTVLRMPKNSTEYASDFFGEDELMDDAIAAAGISLSSYEILVVIFEDIGFGFAGLAELGGGHQWIQGNESSMVITHELGHNYGINHATFWKPGGSNSIGAGSEVEYGNKFDVMGDGIDPVGHFHSHAKRELEWLSGSHIKLIRRSPSTSSTVRLYQIDQSATTGIRGIQIEKGSTESYWVTYRGEAEYNPYLRHGVTLNWEKENADRALLLDMTPTSSQGAFDSPLVLGKTYADTTQGVYITPVAQGGSAPRKWMDVHVAVGSFNSNRDPVASLSGPSSAQARVMSAFSVTASDPDSSDDLVVHWDFGDGSVKGTTEMAVSHQWMSPGTYTVKATVSDKKGGTVTVTKNVSVGDTDLAWTRKLPGGTSVSLNYNAIAGNGNTLVAVANGYFAYSLNDGESWTRADFGNGNLSSFEAYDVLHDGTNFVAVGDYYYSPTGSYRALAATSANGITWTQRSPLSTNDTSLVSIAQEGSRLFAVGTNGLIRRSLNHGVSWTTVNSPVSDDLSSVTSSGSTLVAVGLRQNETGFVLRSTNSGTTWQEMELEQNSYFDAYRSIDYVGFVNGIFLGSGFSTGIASAPPSATPWVKVLDNDNIIATDFAYGQGLYIAIGENSGSGPTFVVATSETGSDWLFTGTPGGIECRDVLFHNDRFYLVGRNDRIYQSGTVENTFEQFTNWRHRYFPGLQGQSDPDEDEDGDEISNFEEYVFSLDPTQNNAAVRESLKPRLYPDHADPMFENRLVMQVTLPESSRSDVKYELKAVNNLTSSPGTWPAVLINENGSTWTGSGVKLKGSTVNGLVTWYLGDPVSTSSADSRFMIFTIEQK